MITTTNVESSVHSRVVVGGVALREGEEAVDEGLQPVPLALPLIGRPVEGDRQPVALAVLRVGVLVVRRLVLDDPRLLERAERAAERRLPQRARAIRHVGAQPHRCHAEAEGRRADLVILVVRRRRQRRVPRRVVARRRPRVVRAQRDGRRPLRRRALQLHRVLRAVVGPRRRVREPVGDVVHRALAEEGLVALGLAVQRQQVGKVKEFHHVDVGAPRLVGRHVEGERHLVAVADTSSPLSASETATSISVGGRVAPNDPRSTGVPIAPAAVPDTVDMLKGARLLLGLDRAERAVVLVAAHQPGALRATHLAREEVPLVDVALQLPSIRRVHLHCSRHCGPLLSVTVLAPSRGGAEPDVSSTVTTSVCESYLAP